jgi:hypothetical protein
LSIKDDSIDLQLDYNLVGRITDDLERRQAGDPDVKGYVVGDSIQSDV